MTSIVPRRFSLAFLLAASLASAAPRTPVVLVNGFQISCDANAPSSNTFGLLQQYLTSDGATVYFFNNCLYPGDSIEKLGQDFGAWLATLKDASGNSVATVDVVAHSMGGLIVRSYLAGKLDAAGSFNPPAAPPVGKLVLISAPNFGTPVASLGFGLGSQTAEMVPGSQFVWDLATWNQGLDDLRGVDALAIVGNAAPFFDSNHSIPGLDAASDGIVSLASSSLAFSPTASDALTRIVPYCHTSLSFFPCSAPSIANVDSPTHLTGEIVRSFLAGTSNWQSIGHTPSQDPILSTYGGSLVEFEDAAGAPIGGVTQVSFGVPQNNYATNGHVQFFNEFIPAQSGTVTGTSPTGPLSANLTLPAGGYRAALVKALPAIARVQPAAGYVSTYDLAPGSIVSLYGQGLASSASGAMAQPLPTELAGASITVNGTALGLLYASGAQINAVLPTGLTGLVQLELKNATGAQTWNLLLAPAVPALFTQDSTGAGPAAALHAQTSQLVTAANPAVPGEFLELYLTGLGATQSSGNLQVATLTPTLTLGPSPSQRQLPIAFAGLAPGFTGLDQINFQVPANAPSGAAVPIQVSSAGFSSNVATLAIR